MTDQWTSTDYLAAACEMARTGRPALARLLAEQAVKDSSPGVASSVTDLFPTTNPTVGG